MAKKKTKDDEQEERSKRSVKQATRKIISTTATMSGNARSSTKKTDANSANRTQATRSMKSRGSVLTSTPSLIPASSRSTELIHTVAQDSVVSKPKTNKTRISNAFKQTTRNAQTKASSQQETKSQTDTQSKTASRGLAFPSNHFQNASSTKTVDENETKTFISGESQLKPIVSFPALTSNRGALLTRTGAQDSIVANPRQAQQKTDIDTSFKTQTVQSNKITGAGRKKSPKVLAQEIWNAVEIGDKQLGYASKLEKELEDKYGDIDYAQYIPKYKNLVKSIQEAQAEYQKQREFIESNYSQLPLPSGQTTNHTNADRWYYEDRLYQTREEMEAYDEMCGGRMDLASLRDYCERIHLYESILAADPNTKGEQYMDDSFEQLLKGNYTDKVTGLGTAYQMGLGLTGLDLPLDIRDAAYDWTHLKTTPWHQTLFDTAAFLPFVGVFKYTDNVADLAKGAKAADALATTAKHADDTVDLAKYLDDAAAAAKKSEAIIDIGSKMDYNSVVKTVGDIDLKPAELMDELISSGVKCTPEEVVMITRTNDRLLWLETGNDSAGWRHIWNSHAAQLAKHGIAEDDIPTLLQQLTKSTPLEPPIKEARGYHAFYMCKGQRFLLAYGTNGYIVSFYPCS